MRDYGAVSPQFWIGKTGKGLRGDPHAQLLALYLMTCPHATMIGVFHCPVVYMAHEIGLPFEGASKALRSLIEAGFCQFDEETDEVFVVRMAAFQIGERLDAKDNRCKSTAREYEKIQSSSMRAAFHATYSVAFHLPRLEKTQSPFEAPSKTLRSQEQEQEQEQDKHALHNSRPHAVDNSGSTQKPQARAVGKEIPKPESPESRACRAMDQAGLKGVSAKHPDVVALVGLGVAPELFGSAATKAVAKGKDFQYVVGILRSQLAESGGVAARASAVAKPWDFDRPGIEGEGERLGLGKWCGNPNQEMFSAYTERVRLARDAETVEA